MVCTVSVMSARQHIGSDLLISPCDLLISSDMHACCLRRFPAPAPQPPLPPCCCVMHAGGMRDLKEVMQGAGPGGQAPHGVQARPSSCAITRRRGASDEEAAALALPALPCCSPCTTRGLRTVSAPHGMTHACTELRCAQCHTAITVPCSPRIHHGIHMQLQPAPAGHQIYARYQIEYRWLIPVAIYWPVATHPLAADKDGRITLPCHTFASANICCTEQFSNIVS